MRVLASFVGGWGHAAPLVPFANEWRERGHRVTFAGQRGALPRLHAAGHRAEPVGPVTLRTTAAPLARVDREHERLVMREHFLGSIARSRRDELEPLVEALRPDLVLCDEVDLAAIGLGATRGIPTVVVSVIAAGRLISGASERRAAADLLTEWGAAADASHGDVFVVPAPPSFRGPEVALPPHAVHVRPSILDRRPVRRPDGPVYATAGTVFDLECGDLLERMVSAVNRLDRAALITIGDHLDPAALGSVAPHVRVERFVPLPEALDGAAVAVTHGGSGTTVAALSCGIPVVGAPMGADQPDNGDRLVELGAGAVVNAVAASPAELAATIERVAGGAAVDGAQVLAAEAQRLPTISDAIEDIERRACG